MAYKFSLGTYRHSGSLIAEEGATVDTGGLTVTAGTSALQAVTSTTLSASSTLQIGGTSTLAQTLTISGGGAQVTGNVGTTAALTVGTSVTAGNGVTATAGDIKASSGKLSSSVGIETAGNIQSAQGYTAATGDIKASSGNLSASIGVQTAGGVTASGNIVGGTVTGSNGIHATGGGITAQSGDIKAQSGQLSSSLSISTGGSITSAQGITATTGDIKASAGYITASLGLFVGQVGGTPVVLGADGRVSGSAGGLFGGNLTTAGNATVAQELRVTGSAFFNNTITGSNTATFASVVSNNVDINGGAIDGTTIGASSQSSVKATTLSASSTLIVDGITTLNSALTVSAGGLTVSSGDSSVQKLTVNGDLIVLGNTFSASVGTIVVEDKQLVLADGASSAALADGAGLFVSGSNIEWTYKQNGEGDASSSGNIWVASGSAGLIDIQAANFYGTLVGSMAATVTNVGNADATLVVGVNYGDTNLTAARTWTLPTSPTVGQSVKVKAPSNCDATNYITIQRAGSQTIDGETSIRLESAFAGVELVYVASNLWRVF